MVLNAFRPFVQQQAEAKAAEEAAKAVAASVRYDKNRVNDMFKNSKGLLDPKSKEYQEVCPVLEPCTFPIDL